MIGPLLLVAMSVLGPTAVIAWLAHRLGAADRREQRESE